MWLSTAIGEGNAIGATAMRATLRKLVADRTFCYQISDPILVGLKEH